MDPGAALMTLSAHVVPHDALPVPIFPFVSGEKSYFGSFLP